MLTQSLRVTLGLLRLESSQLVLVAGIKYFPPPKNYDHIDIPERQRLRIYDKVPIYPSNLKPPKMQKRLRYMRGPEPLHTNLQLQQYGVVLQHASFLCAQGGPAEESGTTAGPPSKSIFSKTTKATGGGRMRSEHFEMARLVVARKLDQKRMFAIWRVDPPWQPVTKKGQGQRMGGGKGAIDHYVTPIKAGRIILEVGGKCDYAEVYPMLKIVAERLPFKAEAVSMDILKKKAEDEKWLEENNQNYYTMKYIIQNNMGGCHRMLSPFDHRWYGKYL